MTENPTAVLFVCTMNSVRSPMAEALLKHFHGRKVYVDSAGVHSADIDGFVVAVMDELGIDMSTHVGKTLDDLEDDYFDLVITLSPDAHHKAVEMTRTMACEVEYWNTFDPTIIEGDRDTKLEAYRQVRDHLRGKILKRFPLGGKLSQ